MLFFQMEVSGMNAQIHRKQYGRGIKSILRSWQLYVLLLPALVWLIVFCYRPMYGLIIAFKDFRIRQGILASPWAGLKHFKHFFSTYNAKNIILNTVILSVENLLISFPIPVIFALLLNSVENGRMRKTVQTISYAPYFVSTVVIVSIMQTILAPSTGFVNLFLQRMGSSPILFTSMPQYFRPLYIISGIWQSMGFNAIIYLSALTSISPEYHEAAKIDGASKLQRLYHIDFKLILPTVVIMFILAIGKLMTLGYEKAYLLQSGMNLATSEIISTYVYKTGLMNAQYSFSTAVSLFNSLINFILLMITNIITKKISDISLF